MLLRLESFTPLLPLISVHRQNGLRPSRNFDDNTGRKGDTKVFELQMLTLGS